MPTNSFRANNNLLNRIIKEVDRNYTINDPTHEILVVIDAQGETLLQKPGITGFLKKHRYFIVNIVNTVTYNGYLCTLENNDGISNINIDYRLKCQPEDVRKLAAFIHDTTSVSDLPTSLIREEVKKSHSIKGITDNFSVKKALVASAVIERLRKAGLTVLALNLHLEGHSKANAPIVIDISSFKVSLLGGTPKATMGVYAKLVSGVGQEVKAINNDLSNVEYEEGLLRIVRNWIACNVTPDELFQHYQTRVTRQAELAVNEWLKGYGRILDEFVLTLYKQNTLEAIEIRTADFIEVRISNSHQPVKIKYRCELVADPRMYTRVYIFPADTVEMEDVIKDEIRHTMAAEVDAELFADELNTRVAALLAVAINERVSFWGRKVGYLQLETDANKIPPRHVEIKHQTECLTRDGYSVTVSNTLLLQRNFNSRKVYEASQFSDLHTWGRSELDRVTKKFIINKIYNELKFAFDGAAIRDEMQTEAGRIGYDVNQLIVFPEFKGDPISNKFNITYKDYYLASCNCLSRNMILVFN